MNKVLVFFSLFILTGMVFAYGKDKKQKFELLVTINNRSVLQYGNEDVLFYTAPMAIDADGSPRAYHPGDTGLDFLANAGSDGNWWALATDTGKKDGIPFIQGKNDLAPGYYVSTTSLFDPGKKRSDPERYVNSEEIPYIVVPASLLKHSSLRPGDMAVVFDIKSGRYYPAIVADTGSDANIGEASIRLAGIAGVKDSPRNGGCPEARFIYILFPRSGNARPCGISVIREKALALFERMGGQRVVNYYLYQKKSLIRR